MSLFLTSLVFVAALNLPQGEPTSAPRELVVGTKQAAPFSFRDESGEWRGISIELWQRIAQELGLAYRFEERSLDQLISDLEVGRLDASVAALTITAAREARVDFTHPFHPSGLGIAVPAARPGLLSGLLKRVASVRFAQAVGTLAAVIALGGVLVWLFERRKNVEQFGGGAVRGLASGFWWSAVTMTTVGYGDKAPVTLGGRLVGLVWMFASIVMISGLTAAVATTLTLSQLETGVKGPHDLASVGRIVTVAGSTSEAYLRDRGLPHVGRPTLDEALEALASEDYRALVYDAPILRYRSITDFAGRVEVLPVTFERQDYAIALPLGSDLRKPLNRVLLDIVSAPAWNRVLTEYLGTEQ